ASSSTGATNKASARSGSREKRGPFGNSATATPPIASNAGEGAPMRRASAASSTAPKRRAKVHSRTAISGVGYLVSITNLLRTSRITNPGKFQAPRKPGIVYMMSDHIYLLISGNRMLHYPPHLMFYAPYATNKDI